MTLADLPPGGTLHVTAVSGSAAFRARLYALGFVPGTPVRVLRRMPLGGPLDVAVRGTRLALRIADARHVQGRAAQYGNEELRRTTMSEAMRLQPGDVAPQFTLPDADGNPVSLTAYRGRRLILYFYPAALTPGCTTEACDFRDNLTDLDAAGIDVLAVSPDRPEKLRRFRDEHALTFPLLSDPDATVLAAYGAWGEKTTYGKKSVGVIRSTFVIDDQGRVERAAYNVRANGHVAELRRTLGV
jgi:peroxiredoxin Q/BCP